MLDIFSPLHWDHHGIYSWQNQPESPFAGNISLDLLDMKIPAHHLQDSAQVTIASQHEGWGRKWNVSW